MLCLAGLPRARLTWDFVSAIISCAPAIKCRQAKPEIVLRVMVEAIHSQLLRFACTANGPDMVCVSDAISFPSSFPNVTTTLDSTQKIAAHVLCLVSFTHFDNLDRKQLDASATHLIVPSADTCQN